MASFTKSMHLSKGEWFFCVLGLVVLLGTLFLMWHQQRMNAPLSVNMEKSFMNEFTVRDDNVVFRCHIAIDNPSGKYQSFSLYAQSPEDVESGLLLPGTMIGYDMDSDVFSFSKGEKSRTFEVEFIGKAGDRQIKRDRLLPSQIEIVDSLQEINDHE